MAGEKAPNRILVYEAIGFAVIVVVTWLDEFLGFPERFLTGSAPHPPEWVEGIVETAAIVAVAIPTMLLTRRLIARVFHLERFMRMCAWCGKINDRERWITVEKFMSSEYRLTTSHGMCPDCFEKATRG